MGLRDYSEANFHIILREAYPPFGGPKPSGPVGRAIHGLPRRGLLGNSATSRGTLSRRARASLVLSGTFYIAPALSYCPIAPLRSRMECERSKRRLLYYAFVQTNVCISLILLGRESLSTELYPCWTGAEGQEKGPGSIAAPALSLASTLNLRAPKKNRLLLERRRPVVVPARE